MKCDECGSDVELSVDREIEVRAVAKSLEDDEIGGKADVVETTIAACDCTTIEVDKRGHRIHAVPPNWLADVRTP